MKKFRIPTWVLLLILIGGFLAIYLVDKRISGIVEIGQTALGYVSIADRTNRGKVVGYDFLVKDSLFHGGFTKGGSVDVVKNNFYEVRYLESNPTESVLMVKNKIDEMKDYSAQANGVVEEARTLGENTLFVRYRFSVQEKIILDSGRVQNAMYARGDSVEVRYSTLRVQYRERFALPMKSEIVKKLH